MITHVCDIAYTIKNLILKLKNSMKKSGKAVDCFFAENYWLFLWYYIIGRSKDREEKGGDG